jgi:hypothetical protein
MFKDPAMHAGALWAERFPLPLQPPDFRAMAAARPLAAYQQIEASPKLTGGDRRGQLERLLRDGWVTSYGTFRGLTEPFSWQGHDRSLATHLQSWEPMAFLLAASDLWNERAHLQLALDYAIHWLDAHMPAGGAPLDRARAETHAMAKADLAWYDMAVGLRLHRLAYLLDAAARTGWIGDEVVERLARAMLFHHLVLSHDAIFRPRSNHGFYQSICQIAAARRFAGVLELSAFEAQGKSRLARLIAAHFHPSGMHLEHSPGYHMTLLTSLHSARRFGLLEDPYTLALIEKIEDALVWMVLPDGSLLTMGDTDPRNMKFVAGLKELATRPALACALADPSGYHRLPQGLSDYAAAGYVFYRNQGLAGGACYIAQQTAFHSQVHKQADHGTLVWFDHGLPVLIDPARYGYGPLLQPGHPLRARGFTYADEKRNYVESTRAHNAIEIDGEDHDRRGEMPFGSGILWAGEVDGCVAILSRIPLGVAHQFRLAVLKPGHFLFVRDELTFADDAEHRVSQWWQFDPAWQAVDAMAGGALLKAEERHLSVMAFAPERPAFKTYRGAIEPRLQGWHSPKAGELAPATSVEIRQAAHETAKFATLLTWSKSCRITPTTHPDAFRWSDGNGSWVLIARPRDGEAPEIQCSSNSET